MKNLKNSVLRSLKEHGIAIITSYYDEKFCNQAIVEMEDVMAKNKNKIQAYEGEGTSGDQRIFKLENQSKCALKFKKDTFISGILQDYAPHKIDSHFILGGKLESSNGKTKNSGGGWHRDSDNIQLKAMLYLKDVDAKNGPFLFIKESKLFDLQRRNFIAGTKMMSKIRTLLGKTITTPPRYKDETINEFLNKKNLAPFEVIGKAGDVVLFDSSFIHRGKNIEFGSRFTLTNYFYSANLRTRISMQRKFGKKFISKV